MLMIFKEREEEKIILPFNFVVGKTAQIFKKNQMTFLMPREKIKKRTQVNEKCNRINLLKN